MFLDTKNILFIVAGAFVGLDQIIQKRQVKKPALGLAGKKVVKGDKEKTAVTGKRLHSNIPLGWLDYPDWQAGYRDILHHQA